MGRRNLGTAISFPLYNLPINAAQPVPPLPPSNMACFVAASWFVQAAPVWMDRAATTKKACHLTHEASQQGARIVAFPESFIPAFPYGVWHHGVRRNMRFYQQLTECAVSLDGPEISMMQERMVSQ